MKLEAGKSYRLADGREVGPMIEDPDGWFMTAEPLDGFAPIWESDGTANFFVERDNPKNEKYQIIGEVR